MDFKQGNTYILSGRIEDVNIEDIAKVVFKFNDIEKKYMSDGSGDVSYSEGIFEIRLSQADTLSLKKDKVAYEVAVKFTDNEVKKSPVYYTNSLKTIIKEEL